MSAIAARHGIALQALLDANADLGSNPDRIDVGQVINVPDSDKAFDAPVPTPSPNTRPAPVSVSPSAWVLGGLSTQYETGGNGPTTISSGTGDAGGVSYGSYQMMSARGGTVGRFVAEPDFPWRADFAGLVPGSAAFSAKWKDIASRFADQFKRVEHDFIKRTHYDPLCKSIRADDDIDVTPRSHTFQDVVWSTAVQQGPYTPVIHHAFERMRARGTFDPAAANFERNAIVAIYTERGRTDLDGTLVYFPHCSPDQQRGVAHRFRDEEAQALRLLAENV